MKFLFFMLISQSALAISLSGFEPLPSQAPFPKDNPPTEAKIKLGRELFLDPRLSATGTTSCLTCHNLSTSGENNRANAIKPDGNPSRHTVPTVFNAAFVTAYFWYGAANSLEEQSEGPLEEMGLGHLETVVKNVSVIPEYVREFAQVFGDPNSITLTNITKALGTYERTLLTPDSPFDLYLKGDYSALSHRAKEGMKLFQKIGCINCHSGVVLAEALGEKGVANFKKFPQFTNNSYVEKFHLAEDLGRYNVTQKEEDKNLWRVPQLRNIQLTSPYFHNGSVKTLEEAVRVMAKTQLNRDLSNRETKNIIEFLKSLTGRLVGAR